MPLMPSSPEPARFREPKQYREPMTPKTYERPQMPVLRPRPGTYPTFVPALPGRPSTSAPRGAVPVRERHPFR